MADDVQLWILDGSLQCGEAPARPIEEFRRQLEQLGIAILGERHDPAPVFVPAVCGAPTGMAYFFDVPDTIDRKKLFLAGKAGFRVALGDEASLRSVDLAGGDSVFPLFGSPLTTPSLIRDLIGRPIRVYKRGDPVTFDLKPNRVNIVLDPASGRIEDIWFG